jgi:hypothetical protein
MGGPRSLASWTDDARVEYFDLDSRGDFFQLASLYEGSDPTQFHGLIARARDAGARTVVAEHRYLDADYRSEHSAFYSTTFRRYPSIAHRLHFFSDLRTQADHPKTQPSRFPQAPYLGYSVLRPISAAPIGRTLVAPPRDLAPFVSCTVTDSVNLYGSDLKVSAAPYMSQDSQLGVCVHVTAWVVAYYHHHAFGGRRWLPSEIAAAAPLHRGRRVPVPTEGLTIEQLTGILDQLELPPLVYRHEKLTDDDDENIFTVCCRYLNSGLPVIVAGGNHAWVLVGYRRVRTALGVTVQFIRQNDRAAPYEVVENPLIDVPQYRPWDFLVVPLPKKLFVSGERAEKAARAKVRETLAQSHTPHARALLDQLNRGALKLRSTALPSNEFKQMTTVARRPMPPALAAAYQWLPMPRWIWVVELVETARYDRGQRCVVGEVLIDATDHTGDLRPVAWRVGDVLRTWDSDRAQAGSVTVGASPRLLPVSKLDTRVVV